MSEDFVGVRLAGAASEQSARQAQDGLENDERSEHRDAYGRPSINRAGLKVGDWAPCAGVRDEGSISQSTSSRLGGPGSCKDRYR